MKLSYVFQLEKFLIMFFYGIVIGIIYDFIINLFNIKKSIILKIIIDTLFCIIATTILILLINTINLGEIRLYLLIAYIFGIIIEHITLGKLFAKGFKFVYTKVYNMAKIIANSKFGRFIFK